MRSLDDLALFVAIVDAGSLVAAARAEGLPKSSVTRRLAGLEARVQARLLQRSTRQLSLTEAGRRLYERLRPVIVAARAAESELMSGAPEPEGVLRITATGAFGRLFIAPLLGTFLKQHRRLTAELLLLDRSVNLIDEGFDLAIRMGPLADSGLVSRKLASIERVLCAAPDHLTGGAPITTVADLRQVDGLVTIEGNRWTFHSADGVVTIKPRVRFSTNQLEVLHAAALSGCGVAVLPRFLIEADLQIGRLVRVLPDIGLAPGNVHALWPSNQNLPARTRAFIEFAAEKLSDPTLLQRSMAGVAER
jgi:DNA-binding transcriptional LysR family regulator